MYYFYTNAIKASFRYMILLYRILSMIKVPTSLVDFQPKMALPGGALPKLAIYTPK